MMWDMTFSSHYDALEYAEEHGWRTWRTQGRHFARKFKDTAKLEKKGFWYQWRLISKNY